MRHGDNRTSMRHKLLPDELLHDLFARIIQARRDFVQDQDRGSRPDEHGSREDEELRLAGRKGGWVERVVEDGSERSGLCGGDEDGPKADAFEGRTEFGVGAAGFWVQIPSEAAWEQIW